jgi:hypothetical protein
MQNDTKANGKVKSFQDMRKHRDAMRWRSKAADERTPKTFYEKTDVFLESCKKKFIHGKKADNVDGHATDPIPVPVHELLLKWSVETNNVFAWFWTVSQWNFGGRSASMDPLGFHNFNLGVDSIIGKHDNLKADKTGERLPGKNTCAHPLNWHMRWWTGMGICCAVFAVDLEKLKWMFLRPGVEDGTEL